LTLPSKQLLQFQEFTFAPTAQDELAACPGQSNGEVSTDAVARAGDYGYLPANFEPLVKVRPDAGIYILSHASLLQAVIKLDLSWVYLPGLGRA
jgi:hypothetical protein